MLKMGLDDSLGKYTLVKGAVNDEWGNEGIEGVCCVGLV
jgi:hypothetical protein